MLYIFHVEIGNRIMLEMNLALESVSNLKMQIEQQCNIPANSQVLLVSGGETLRPEARVCSYKAGTDTNPIYMFSKSTFNDSKPPVLTMDMGPEGDLSEQVDMYIAMTDTTPSYGTVSACAQLAQKISESAKEHTMACENLVRDQILQHQGWTAVVANMEDAVDDFQMRSEDFYRRYDEHMKKKVENLHLLNNFDRDLEALSNIPILPALRYNAVSNPFSAFEDLQTEESHSHQPPVVDDGDENSESNNLFSLEGQKDSGGIALLQTDVQTTTGSNEGSSKTSSVQGPVSEGDEGIESYRMEDQTCGSSKFERGKSARHSLREALTLLQWITLKENQESLRDIARYSKSLYETFNSNVIDLLKQETEEALQNAHKESMIIKGLEERLIGLENLLKNAKAIEQEQKDLAYSFKLNQQRAANVGDSTVLKVLCESYSQQLQSMQKNELKLKDIKRRMFNAKQELTNNIYTRLRWIIYVENRMFESGSRVLIYNKSLQRLKKHLTIIGQLHQAPKLFYTAVDEIIRRRVFSQAFLSWASNLSTHLLTIHNEEISRRRSFNSLFAGHFLQGLFPGTSDEPPPFGINPPTPFDIRLPKLTQADLQTLVEKMPQLSSELPPYDLSKVTTFFSQRPTLPDKATDNPPVDERLLAVARETGIDRGFESETDTEEYEKVAQSPLLDRVPRQSVGGVPSTPLPATVTADSTTLTEVRPRPHPPVKPPRKSLPLAKLQDLTPIPEVSSPLRDAVLSHSAHTPILFSPPELFSNEFISNTCAYDHSSYSHSSYLESPSGSFQLPPPSPSSPTAAAPGVITDLEPATFYIEESPPTSLHWSHSPEPLASLLQENHESQRKEVMSLKETLLALSAVSVRSISVLRNELDKLKNEAINNGTSFKEEFNNLSVVWEKFIAERNLKEREMMQRLTVDHELELNDIKQTLSGKNDEIASLKSEYALLDSKRSKLYMESTMKIGELEMKIVSTNLLVEELEKKLAELEASKQKALKELEEKMSHECKAQLESLRSRFRLVATSMDRSPSESSLEKIERADVIEITNHQAILAQTKEDFEIEKEEAIKAALEAQSQEWKSKMEDELEKLRVKHELEKQVSMNDAVRRIIEEKDRQLELSKEHETTLLRECMKYKEIIHQLNDPETTNSPSMNELRNRLDALEAEKLSLQSQLDEKTSQVVKISKGQQTDTVELKDSSTSYIVKSRQTFRNHPMSLDYGSCNKGDNVMLVYDHEYSNFTIVQDNPSIYLLHIDSLATLDLRIPDKNEEKVSFYVGIVEDIHYCVAVKSKNRYNVPRGTKFYRVKVRPLKPSEVPMKGQYCDITIVKEKESSQKRDSANMSSSTISSSNVSSTSKSVIMVQSMSKKMDEPSCSSAAIAEDGEQPDSIELNVPEHEQESESRGKMVVNNETCNSAPCEDPPAELPNAPEESVPYEVTRSQEQPGVTNLEHLVSEVGEEAAP